MYKLFFYNKLKAYSFSIARSMFEFIRLVTTNIHPNEPRIRSSYNTDIKFTINVTLRNILRKQVIKQG